MTKAISGDRETWRDGVETRMLAAAMDRLSASPGDPRVAAGLSAQLKQAQAALDAA